MVYLCNSIAALNAQVTVDVVNTEDFPDLVSRYQVGQVPKVLINGTVEVLGVVSVATLVEKIVAATAATGPGSSPAHG